MRCLTYAADMFYDKDKKLVQSCQVFCYVADSCCCIGSYQEDVSPDWDQCSHTASKLTAALYTTALAAQSTHHTVIPLLSTNHTQKKLTKPMLKMLSFYRTHIRAAIFCFDVEAIRGGMSPSLIPIFNSVFSNSLV